MFQLKSDLAHELKVEINRRHPILAGLSTHAADVISRPRVGNDRRRTAEKRRTGQTWRKPSFQFGKLIYMPKTECQERGSYEQVMTEGHIGHHDCTGALLVMTFE